VNTCDPTYFPENIKEAFRLRKINHADKSNSKLEVDADLYHLIMGSNQIVHNRGRALAYLGGDKKRGRPEAGAGGIDDGGLAPHPKREGYMKVKALYTGHQQQLPTMMANRNN
jgi:hypothetical protein